MDHAKEDMSATAITPSNETTIVNNNSLREYNGAFISRQSLQLLFSFSSFFSFFFCLSLFAQTADVRQSASLVEMRVSMVRRRCPPVANDTRSLRGKACAAILQGMD